MDDLRDVRLWLSRIDGDADQSALGGEADILVRASASAHDPKLP